MERGLSQKIYLVLPPPSEEDMRADKERILGALQMRAETEGMPIETAYSVLKSLHGICMESEWKITVTLVRDNYCWRIIAVESGNTTAAHYGYCVDLGSTTIVMQLVDMATKKALAQENRYNSQIEWGEDILSRIFYTKTEADGLARIHNATMEDIRELMKSLERKTGISAQRCSALVVSGNTTMIHFFLEADPWPLFEAPNTPVFFDAGFISAKELDMGDFAGVIYCMPSVANYLGGDIVSGMIATKIHRSEELSVFLDIGTNGELVVGNQEFLVSGAGAAGPALEGGVSKTGMRAEKGAVDSVKIVNVHQPFVCTTIEGKPAQGICGSGIVDLIAELFLHGLINSLGKFVPETSEFIRWIDGEYAVQYVPADKTAEGKPLYFYQSDILQFLTTKAAAYTMVEYMLEQIGLEMSEVDRFYVAGAFGTYLRTQSAVTIGLYPELPEEKIICAGNSSLEGAYRLLTDQTCLSEIQSILSHMQYIQFGAVGNFVERMNGAKFIPHADTSRYPEVIKKVNR